MKATITNHQNQKFEIEFYFHNNLQTVIFDFHFKNNSHRLVKTFNSTQREMFEPILKYITETENWTVEGCNEIYFNQFFENHFKERTLIILESIKSFNQ